jgi:hypothetical protein
MSMEIIDPVDYPRWNELIASCRGSSFFHSSNWAAVLMESYSYRPLYFARRQGVEISELVPVMEANSFLTGKRGISLPFTDICEPIVQDEASFSSIFDEILRYGKKAGWKYLELRGGTKQLGGAVPYISCVRHVLKRHGVPPQPRSFFKSIYRNVISKDKGFTVLATLQGLPISGAVYFHSNGKAIYKFGASDLRYQHLRPANLVMWEAIRWFSNNGFSELCFGRSEPENAGLIHFKSGWGAQEAPLHYYRYDLKKSAFEKGSSAMNRVSERIFRGLPVSLLRLAGELLYRHVG